MTVLGDSKYLEGSVWIPTVFSEGWCDGCDAGEAEQADRGVAQGGQGSGCVASS